MRETYGNNIPRGALQFEFPGAPGNYNLNVTYLANDPEGKTKYVVSVREPRPMQVDLPKVPAAPADKKSK